MKLHDSLWGALLVAFSGALALHVATFPKIPGQQVGPSALPTLVAAGLAVCGLVLIVRGWRTGGPWFEWPEWFAHPPQLVGFLVFLGVNLLYLLAAQRLGFVVVGTVYVLALMLVLRVPLVRALLLAPLVTLAIHALFYKLLKVPLPWGVLQSVAW